MVQYIKTYVLDFVCKGLNLFQPKLNFLNILMVKIKKKLSNAIVRMSLYAVIP